MKENIKDILIIHLYNLEKEVDSLCKDTRLNILREVIDDSKEYIEERKLLDKINCDYVKTLDSIDKLELSEIDIVIEKIKYLNYIKNDIRLLFKRCFG